MGNISNPPEYTMQVKIAFIISLIVLSSLLFGADDIDDTANVNVLIKQHGSSDWRLRQKARETLLCFSNEVGPLLIKTLKDKEATAEFKKQLEMTLVLVNLKQKGINGGAADKDLKIYLDTKKDSYVVGDKLELQVWIQNKLNKPATIVGSLDSSCTKRRKPYATFSILKPSGKPIEYPTCIECKLMNFLRMQDMIRVYPGEILDPYMKIDGAGFFENYVVNTWTPDKPGKYSITFHYDSTGPNEEWLDINGCGEYSVHEDDQIFKDIIRVKTDSNTLIIDVKEKK
ncbi:hypothetical protein ACFL54_01595 [Planctomycetota bacterium]